MNESIFARAQQSTDEIAEIIAAELPGLQFDVRTVDHTMMTTLHVRRYVENYVYPIDQHMLSQRGAPGGITSYMLDNIRRKVTEDYGLTGYIERQKQEAARDARETMARALTMFAESLRPRLRVLETVEADDGSGDTYEAWVTVLGDLPIDVAALLGRAQRLAAAEASTRPKRG
jgi:hypothetical protein